MQVNWVIIVLVVILAIALVAYLIRQNQKDKKDTIQSFNHEPSNFDDDESVFDDKV